MREVAVRLFTKPCVVQSAQAVCDSELATYTTQHQSVFLTAGARLPDRCLARIAGAASQI